MSSQLNSTHKHSRAFNPNLGIRATHLTILPTTSYNAPSTTAATMPSTPESSPPVTANISAENLTISAGIAIFHLASSRVVLCYHTRDKYYFLPKGRKNVHEDLLAAAEREGFEESGMRGRVIGVPIGHRQTLPEDGEVNEDVRFAKEPIWTQMLPLRPGTTSKRQYLLFWFVGETVPKGIEEEYWRGETSTGKRVYRSPSPFPVDMTLRQRVDLDFVVGEDGTRRVYEPLRHEGTGVNEEELLYTAELVPVDEAVRKLGGSLMADVVRKGWEGLQLRLRMEDEDLVAKGRA